MSDLVPAVVYLLGGAVLGAAVPRSLRESSALSYAALGVASAPSLSFLQVQDQIWHAVLWGVAGVSVCSLASLMRHRSGSGATLVRGATVPRYWHVVLGALSFALVFGAAGYTSTVSRVVMLDTGWELQRELWSDENYRRAQLEWLSLPLGVRARAPVVLAIMTLCLGTALARVTRLVEPRWRSLLMRLVTITVGAMMVTAAAWLFYVARSRSSEALLETLVHAFDWGLVVGTLSVAMAWSRGARGGAWLAAAVAAVVSVRFADFGAEKMEMLQHEAWADERALFLIVQVTLCAAVAVALIRAPHEPVGRRTTYAFSVGAGFLALSGLVLQIDGQTWFAPVPLEGRLTPTARCAGSEIAGALVVDARESRAVEPEQVRAAMRATSGGSGSTPLTIELWAPLEAPAKGLIETLAVAAEHGYSLSIAGELFSRVDLLTHPPFQVRLDRCSLMQVSLGRLAHGERPAPSVNTVEDLAVWLNAPASR